MPFLANAFPGQEPIKKTAVLSIKETEAAVRILLETLSAAVPQHIPPGPFGYRANSFPFFSQANLGVVSIRGNQKNPSTK